MSHSSTTTRTATRATTMYSSSSSAPVPAPRPKSDHFVDVPRRQLPPPPPAIPTNHLAIPPKRPAPTQSHPSPPLSPTSSVNSTVVPPKRTLPAPPATVRSSYTATASQAAVESEDDQTQANNNSPTPRSSPRSQLTRPPSIASSITKPDRPVPPLPARSLGQQPEEKQDYPHTPTISARPLPLPRRPSSIVGGLAKPPVHRPPSIASIHDTHESTLSYSQEEEEPSQPTPTRRPTSFKGLAKPPVLRPPSMASIPDTPEHVSLHSEENEESESPPPLPPAPHPRRSTKFVSLAKPPLHRPMSSAAPERAASPVQEEDEPEEPVPTLPRRNLIPPGVVVPSLEELHNKRAGLHKAFHEPAEYPKRVLPDTAAPTLVEFPKRVAPHDPTPAPAPATVLKPVEAAKRMFSATSTQGEAPKRVVPIAARVEPAKRVFPPVELPRRTFLAPLEPGDLPKRAVPTPPAPTVQSEPAQEELPPPIPSRAGSQLLKRIQDLHLKQEDAARTVTPETKQQETPPPIPSRSGSVLLKKMQNGHAKEATPAPVPPSKPRRLPTTPPTQETKMAELNEEPTPTPSPIPPSLPQRRPTIVSKPSLPQRPTLPQRPELPQRPVLPKRPEQRVTTHSEQHHTSTHESSILRTTGNGSTYHHSSDYSASSHASTSVSTPLPASDLGSGGRAQAILARSAPVFTQDFTGDRLDLTLADFTIHDEHAKACPRSEEESIARLSYYLTSPFPGDQVAQLRAIFAWIAFNLTYNMTGFLAGSYGDNSAETVLRTKTGVCAGFANLFSALAEPQQLGVTQVTGLARGYGIEVGGESLGGGHAWNTVTINGECLLIDSTWGAGADCPRTGVVKTFKPAYFLIRPERLIYSHWPGRAWEQFLDPPIGVEVYRDLPFRNVDSWSLGIEPTGRNASHTVRTDDDYYEVEVRLEKRAWDGATSIIGAHMDWDPTGERIVPSCQWTHEDSENVLMTIKCFCPTPGSGTMMVYGRPAGDQGLTGISCLQYKIVNTGSGANAQPMMQTYGVRGFSYSIIEPITAKVHSGVMQTIRVKVFNVDPGTTSPRPVMMGGFMPEPMKQIEPGLFEVQKVLRPGQYRIGYMSGMSMAGLGVFEAV